MVVEIRNVHHRNKGAELMLRAIVDHYAGRTDVTLTGNHRVGSRRQLRALGIRPLLFVWHERGFLAPPAALVPAALRRRLGVVHPEEVDLVLDAAGFAYGDQWGPSRAIAASRYYRYLKARGTRIVLMPQSLGPFERADVRDAAARLFEHVDLMFPRDDTAAACVADLLGGEDPRVVQCPDFTPLLAGTDGPPLPPGDRPAAIIPNDKMIQQGGLTEAQYLDFLVAVVERFRALGFSPFVLPHATFDHDLVSALRARLETEIPAVVEPDAARLKGIIGRCHAVFSSRFHGLVSALSQGVPVIATGWSHKYRHLLDEYGCPDALVDASVPGALDRAVEQVLAGDRYAATRTVLAERAAWNKDRAHDMWARIEAVAGDA